MEHFGLYILLTVPTLVAKAVDTTKINAMLKSKMARDIFNLRRYKFGGQEMLKNMKPLKAFLVIL